MTWSPGVSLKILARFDMINKRDSVACAHAAKWSLGVWV